MPTPLAFIIEDDPDALIIFETAVRDAQFETVCIKTGTEAMEWLKKSTPDLVVLDLRLPGIPGVSVLQAIMNDTRMKKTRVIVISADATLTEYVREQADLVLVKPVGYNQLREMASRLKPEGDQ